MSKAKTARPKSTVVKISFEVRDFIKTRAAKSEDGMKLESVDVTIRKLLGKQFKDWLKSRNGSRV